MKKIFTILSLVLGLGQVWAETRTFDGSTKFYVMNYKPSGLGGSTLWAISDDCKFYFDLVDGSAGHHWYEATLVSGSGAYSEGAIYSITPDAGTYSYFIMTRGKGKSFGDATNQTGNIGFHSDASYNLVNGGYDKDGTGTTWGKLTPKSVTSDGTGVLYFNGSPSSATWWKDYGADRQSAFFYNNTSGKFTTTSVLVSGNYYKVSVPEGTWTGVILTRHNDGTTNPSWDNKCNQTQDIPLVDGKNYLSNFGEAPGTYTWEDFIPTGTTVLNGTMNDWSLITAKAFTDGELEIDLPDRKTMSFKIVEGNNGGGTWYGLTDANCILSDMAGWGMLSGSDGKNTRINTAGAGTYTFAFNGSHQLSVTYPTVTHPNADYVYLIKYGWSSWRIHFDQASTTYGIAKTTWTGQELTVASGTITNTYDYTAPGALSAQTYFYYAVGDYPKFNFNDNSSSNQTNDQTPSPGQYMYNDGDSWEWGSFVYGVTLNTNSGTIEDGHDVTEYTFGTGATLPNSDYISRTGYTFGGWYEDSGFEGSAITEITTTDNGDKTYYAKWTPIPYSISYELDGGTKFFADTQTSYNIESSTITLHAAAKSGYVFAGWYDNSSFTGDVITSIPTGSYGDKTLYAKWESTTCIGEHSAGTAFHMIMDTNSDETPTDVVLSAGQYADLSSYATFNGNRGTAVYGTTSSDAKILKGGPKDRRRLQMSSTSHVVTLNLSCPLVAYDTIIISDTHGTTEGKTYEFSITSSPTYSGTNSTSGATVSKTADTTRYVVPVGSGLIGVTPIYVWGSASSDLRIRQIEIRRTNTWQLTYHGNGTSGLTPTNVPAAEYRPASPVALTSTVPVLGNYTFAGWNTATDGSGTNYASGADYTIPSASTTLYAKWTLDVTLNDNGGTGGSTSVTMTHKSATHSAITLPTRAGYEFVGYYDDDSGGRRVTDETGALLPSVGNYTSSDRTWKYSTADLTLYAQWAPDLTFTGGTEDHETEWNTTGNWSPASLPTIYSNVTIEAPVTVNIANAKAKSIVIYNDGDTKTGKLTVAPGKALAVATTIQKTTDGENYTATSAADIVLASDGTNGTGALVAGEESTNTAATVQFYTKANAASGWVNQYFGIPVDTTLGSSYYGAYLYEFDAVSFTWNNVKNGAKMKPFYAYNILRSENTTTTFDINGTLILPGTTEHKVKTLDLYRDLADYKEIDPSTSEPYNTINMFANSWTAPIDITAMETTDFINTVPTIYIFNAGTLADLITQSGSYGEKDVTPGQWLALPISSVKANPNDYLTVIPSQQAFLVNATGTVDEAGEHHLYLDYKKLVYDSIATKGATIVPNRAPKRSSELTSERMRLIVESGSGFRDRVMMHIRSDFSAGFDNGWDGSKIEGESYTPQLYAITEGGYMSVNCVPTAEGTVLGFRTGSEDNTYTFSFSYDGSETWYLNDLKEQKSAQITDDNSYTFTAVTSDATARFIISATPIAQTPTGITNPSGNYGYEVQKIMINGTMYIIRAGRMYSADGMLIK